MNIDKYVISIKRLYVAMSVLAISVGYFASEEQRRLKGVAQAMVLEGVLALSKKTKEQQLWSNLTSETLERVSQAANWDAARANNRFTILHLRRKLVTPKNKKDHERRLKKAKQEWEKFLGNTYKSALFLQEIKSRSFQMKKCYAAAYRGAGDVEKTVNNMIYHYFSARFPLSKVYLINFSRYCQLSLAGINSVVLIELDKKNSYKWLVGLPTHNFKQLDKTLPADVFQASKLSLNKKVFEKEHEEILRKYI
ncbi:MAG TPA: hypothetical protein VMW24_09230, partial [Sedimentisphaerales bacterium]|nr:hypothetical protein [Sedimentisphaerales bacterium]